MHHRLLDLHLRWQEGVETLHRLAYVHRSRTVIVDAVGGEKPPLRLVNLLPVVGNYGAQNETYIEGWEKKTSKLLIYKRLCKI